LLEWPRQTITVNLAPAAIRKEGTGYDLAIALTILAASAQVPAERLESHACIGELGLDGRVRPVAGTIAAAEGAGANAASTACGSPSAVATQSRVGQCLARRRDLWCAAQDPGFP
jgi:magnesium chelatase family protein